MVLTYDTISCVNVFSKFSSLFVGLSYAVCTFIFIFKIRFFLCNV